MTGNKLALARFLTIDCCSSVVSELEKRFELAIKANTVTKQFGNRIEVSFRKGFEPSEVFEKIRKRLVI